jgi:opacity protein-like surface antigen
MRRFRPTLFVLLLLLLSAAPAWADATLFLGATTTPTNRTARGGAIGTGLLVVGFEFEYSSTTDDVKTGAPSMRVGSANGLLQTPVAIFRFQPYVTAGAGIFRERVGSSTDTGIAPNVGGGAKISLVGPLRVRVDYRAFKLGSGARYSPSHRFYVGLNLKF